MTTSSHKPRIAIPIPTSLFSDYNDRCWPQYAAAVEVAGGEPVRIHLELDPAQTATLAAGCCGILLPGSPADVNPQKYGQVRAPETSDSDPGREATDELLLQDAFHLRKPLLGICFGLQMMNVWRGGTLTQHLMEGHTPTTDSAALLHTIALQPKAMLLRSFFPEDRAPRINSSHHQAVEAAGDGLILAAVATADGVVEALEGTSPDDQFVLGVQWHPERLYGVDQPSAAIFSAFLDAARRWHLPHE